jgi:precorrin-2 methylase
MLREASLHVAGEPPRGTRVSVVANCGMENERVWKSIDEIAAGETTGYFTLIIIKDREQP